MLVNNTISRIVNISMLCFSLMLSQPLLAQTTLQSFPKGKIFLKKGQVLEGKNLEISTNSAVLVVNNAAQSFNLSDIQQIMAKKGKAKKWAITSGGSCLAISLLSVVTTGGEYQDEYGNTIEIDTGQFLLGAAFWGAIFYGGGYLVGNLADDWEIVYFGN